MSQAAVTIWQHSVEHVMQGEFYTFKMQLLLCSFSKLMAARLRVAYIVSRSMFFVATFIRKLVCLVQTKRVQSPVLL